LKKLIIFLLCASLTAFIAWQYRIELVVKLAPVVRDITDPIAKNQPVIWPQGPSAANKSPTQRRPNIILIVVDDMGFNDISLYNGAGTSTLATPNIDALAQQGVVFNNGYAANAVCAPSRASIMTGRYSTRFGFEFTPIFKLGPTIFNWMQQLEPQALPMLIDTETAKTLPDITSLGMPASEFTIAELLQQQGYYTAHIGKWHLGSVGDMRPEKQGFDDSLELAGALYLPEDHPNVVNAKQEKEAIERMVWATGRYAARFNGGKPFAPKGYVTDYYTEQALNVIDANQHRPFFMYLAHWGVHNPLQATKQDYQALAHIKDHGQRVYAAMIRALDRSVEKINQKLKQSGLDENTLIVFTSDNGGANYIHLADINKPYRGWKLSHFEGGTHVPFMAKWPAKIKAGTQFDKAIHHIDIFATLRAAAGAEQTLDRKIDGVNLLPFINGDNSAAPHQTLFWRQGQQQTVLHQSWKLIRAAQPELGPDAHYKHWLFNLANDPTEKNNLAAQQPNKVKALEELLARHNAEQAKPLWPSVINAPVIIDRPGSDSYQAGDEYIYWPN